MVAVAHKPARYPLPTDSDRTDFSKRFDRAHFVFGQFENLPHPACCAMTPATRLRSQSMVRVRAPESTMVCRTPSSAVTVVKTGPGPHVFHRKPPR